MQKQAIIEHLRGVVAAVWRAEDKVRPLYEQRLNETKDKGQEAKYRLYLEYAGAVAEEMLRATPDEELERLYQDDNDNE